MELVKTPHSDTPGIADRQSGVPAMGITPDGRLPAQYRTAVDLEVLTLCRAVCNVAPSIKFSRMLPERRIRLRTPEACGTMTQYCVR